MNQMTRLVVLLLFLICGSHAVGSQSTFLEQNQPDDGKERCVADIALLVDQSTTITSPTYYQYVVPFLKNITQNFDIGPDRSHLAMVRFCTPEETGIVFDFNYTQTLPAILSAIDASTYCAGTTAMETALNLTYTSLFAPGHGVRPMNPAFNNMSRIVIIVTDGIATDAYNASYIPAVDMLIKDRYVAMFAVGVGPELTPEYLQMLTGRPDNKNFFVVDDFEHLYQAVQPLVNATSCVINKKTVEATKKYQIKQ